MSYKPHGRRGKLPDYLLDELRSAVGRHHVLTGKGSISRYNKGYRIGGGELKAVARPGTLVEMWRAAQACLRHGAIMIVQASNTGLTGGSTPFGSYDRPVVVLSTIRIQAVIPIQGGWEAICLAGSTLTQLEDAIRPMGRMPHSVIGSSCIGASVIGGICNNSGGALVRRGPAFTRYSLFARVTMEGELELVNHLGRDLGETSEQILGALDRGDPGLERPSSRPDEAPDQYVDRLRKAKASPARYNAAPFNFHDASGCAGKLIVFAVRVPTFEAPKRERTFMIGTNSADRLAVLRRAMLDGLDPLPSTCEYMHRSASSLADIYGRDIARMLSLFGPRAMPKLLALQKRVDSIGHWLGLGEYAAAHISHMLFASSKPVSRAIKTFFGNFEHVLLVTTDGEGINRLSDLLETACRDGGMQFLSLTDKESDAVYRLRFSSAGSAVRVRDLDPQQPELAALDIALPRDTLDWFFELPDRLEHRVKARAIYGHFLCHVFHLDFVLRPGVARDQFEREVKQLVEARGGQMPAEHNFGHLYEAPDHVAKFYRTLDPTNSLNPGIGKTSRKKDWAQ